MKNRIIQITELSEYFNNLLKRYAFRFSINKLKNNQIVLDNMLKILFNNCVKLLNK